MSYIEIPARKCEYGCTTHLRNSSYRQAHIMDGSVHLDMMLDGKARDDDGYFRYFKIKMKDSALPQLGFRLVEGGRRFEVGAVHRVAVLRFDEQHSGLLKMPTWWWSVALEIGRTWQHNMWSVQSLRVEVTF